MTQQPPPNDAFQKCYARLSPWRQEHVLRFWPTLAPTQQRQLCAQIEHLDLELLQRLYQQLDADGTSALPEIDAIGPPHVLSPPEMADLNARDRWQSLGGEALQRGEVAVLLVAGGQGTRLGYAGPKGTFPVGPVSGKSLFQIHAEKVLARGRHHGGPLPLYIMTSPDNHETTCEFFAERRFFGLSQEDVVFFPQGTMPVLDLHTGRLLLEKRHRIATSPDGHGGVLKALVDGGHLEDMQRRGIRYIFSCQVDNPLVKIADPAYLGQHIAAEAEISLKVVRKQRPEERLGLVVEVDGRVQMIEYSDLPAEVAARRTPDGALEFSAGNIAVHIFDVALLQRLVAEGITLPYHRAIKRVAHVDERGELFEPEETNAVKFESFIFDVIPLAQRTLVVETDRREEFEPLKNAEGENSPQTVRQAISDLFAGWLETQGVRVPRRSNGSSAWPIEISPLLALDAGQLKHCLQGREAVEQPLLLEGEEAPTTDQSVPAPWHIGNRLALQRDPSACAAAAAQHRSGKPDFETSAGRRE